jgi:hypothetical protein
MSKKIHFKLLMLTTVLVISLVLPGLASAQSDDEEIAHLLLVVEGTVNVNREGWDDYNTFSPAYSGTPIRARDYLQVTGNSRAVILCADLTIVEQFADGVVDCNSNPNPAAFIYFNSVLWDETPQPTPTVVSQSTLPPEADGVSTEDLDDNSLAVVNSGLQALANIGLDDESYTYATANLLATYGLYYDAINVLVNTGELDCTVQRAFVEPDTSDGVISAFESPQVYLRLGEWYHTINGQEASERYLNCAFELSGQLGDIANQALAAARLGDLSTETSDKIFWYQQAINLYAPLTATNSIQSLIEACGSSNCTQP